MEIIAWRALLGLCIALLAGGLVAGGRMFWRGRPRPFTLQLIAGALAVEALLGVTWLASLGSDWPDLLKWLANIDREFTPGTLFSSAQLLVAGATALTSAALMHERWRAGRAFLLATGGVFLFLGLDELLGYHELVYQQWPDFVVLGLHLWRVLYAFGGAALALVTFVLWRRAQASDRRPFALLLTGLAIMGLSGIVAEHVILQAFCRVPGDPAAWLCRNPWPWLIFEELFEIIGVTLVLAALLLLAQERLEPGAWRRLTRTVTVLALLVVTGLPAWLWLLPTLELRLTATPLHLEWRDGNLQLQGLRLDGSPAAPGDEVSIWLYWRALRTQPADLHLSVHALERPALADSLASVEESNIGQYDNEGWFPGLTVRKRLTLRLPQEIRTPASLAIMLRIWRGNWARGQIEGVDIHHSQLQLLGTDRVMIGSIAVPGAEPDTPLASVSGARFGDSFTLKGYTLPESASAGGVLALELDWQALKVPASQYIRFLHLFSQETGAFVAGYDDLPFDGRFPTIDWPPGRVLRDQWRMTLPEELAPGNYRLVFGLYEAQTKERLPLQQGGATLPDGLLPMGTIRVLPGEPQDAQPPG